MLTVVDERDRAFVMGASDYLVKPIDQRRLIEVVQAHRSTEAVPDDAGEAPVLIVEDDDALRELLRRTLEEEGFYVTVAATGREALERVDERRPAAVLLDLILPEIDGIQVVSALRASPDQHTIPIVVLTASELSDQERARLNAAVDQILQKGSVSHVDLVRQVRDAVHGRTAAPAERMR
jgi:DNA-binding response OmpR family regulator